MCLPILFVLLGAAVGVVGRQEMIKESARWRNGEHRTLLIFNRFRIHLSLCAILLVQVCKPGPSLPSWPGCLLPSPGPWTVQKGSRAILLLSTFQDERIVLSNVTGLGVCITNVCPKSKEVILASVPVLNFSGVHRGSLRGRV